MKLVLITTARNEENYISRTFASVLKQKVRPDLWVVVNDGSTDKTEEIIKSYHKKFPWIICLTKKDRGFHLRGKGVVNAFYSGYKIAKRQKPKYIGILDADTTISPDYFKTLLQNLDGNPKLGITGGGIYEYVKGEWKEPVKLPNNFVRGASKIYRFECFRQIGGLYRGRGWDSIDNSLAEMKGWEVFRLDKIKVKHNKVIGQRDGPLKDGYMIGRDAYFIGSDFWLVLMRGINKIRKKPYFLLALAFLFGYFWNKLLKSPRYPNDNLLRYINMMHKRIRREGFIYW